MFGFLKKLLSKNKELVIDDPDFGEIAYKNGSWIMVGRWVIPELKASIRCIDIPGTEYGPSSKAREFLLLKKRSIEALWKTYSPDLLAILVQNDLAQPDSNPKEVLHIESFAGDSDEYWEVAFQTDATNTGDWMYICIEIRNEIHRIVTTTQLDRALLIIEIKIFC